MALFLLFSGAVGLAETGPGQTNIITIYPVTFGRTYVPERPMARVLITSLDVNAVTAAAVAAAKNVFERGGLMVIDKPIPRSLVMNHGPRLPDHAPIDPGLLAFGKEVGADHLVLIDVTDTLVLERPERVSAGYLHDEQVVVRGFSINSGFTVIEGSARWSQPVEHPGQHIRQLTAFAIARALCSPDKWEEASARNNGRGRCRN